MARIYKHLTTQERAVVMTMRDDQCSTRSIATQAKQWTHASREERMLEPALANAMTHELQAKSMSEPNAAGRNFMREVREPNA